MKDPSWRIGRADEPQSETPTTRCTPFIEGALYELKAYLSKKHIGEINFSFFNKIK